MKPDELKKGLITISITSFIILLLTVGYLIFDFASQESTTSNEGKIPSSQSEKQENREKSNNPPNDPIEDSETTELKRTIEELEENKKELNSENSELRSEISGLDKKNKDQKIQIEKSNSKAGELQIKIQVLRDKEFNRGSWGEHLKEIIKNKWMIPILILILVLASISIIISLGASSLYKWRRFISSSSQDMKEIMIPEQFKELMDRMQKNMHNTTSTLKSNELNIRNLEKNNEREMHELIKTIIDFKKLTASLEKENKRLKDGYDLKITKDVLKTFIHIKERMNAANNDSGMDEKKINQMIDFDIDAAFGKFSIESFEVKEGSLFEDYKENEVEIIEKKEPDSKDKEYKIFKVHGKGYKVEISEGKYFVISPASVDIYTQYKEKEEEIKSENKGEKKDG